MNSSNNTFSFLAVGQKFPTEIALAKGQDMLCAMEMYFDERGQTAQLFLIQAVDNIKPIERTILDNEKIHTKVYMRNDQMIFLFRYGKTSMMLEATFDASVYNKLNFEIDLKTVELSNLLTIVRVNPATNCIESLRAATLPKKFRERLIQAVRTAVDTPNYTQFYREWVNTVWKKYQSTQLWSLAETTGNLGE